MMTDTHKSSTHWGKFWFLAMQVIPPTLMFWVVFGHWAIGVAMIIGIPMVFSVVSIVMLLGKKQFHYLLRPALTVLFALIVIVMGNYYSSQAARYLDDLALQMQQQCNRDGECKLPPGEWEPSGRHPTLFHSYTQGLVPIKILLSFNEYEPNMAPHSCKMATQPECLDGQSKDTPRFMAFHLTRQVEDHHYDIYGGVGRSLNTLQ